MLSFSSSSRSSQSAWFARVSSGSAASDELEVALGVPPAQLVELAAAPRAARARTPGSSRAARSEARRRRRPTGGRGSCRRARRGPRTPRRGSACVAADGVGDLQRAAAREDAEPREQQPARTARAGCSSSRSRRGACRCRAGRSWAPPVRRSSRFSSRPRIACGESSFTRAAASSIASGSPSSRRQIPATAAAFSSVSSKSGLTARARSRKNSTAGELGRRRPRRPARAARAAAPGTRAPRAGGARPGS